MLDALRQVVHLRAYAQKKPIDEYKHEAFSMFERMLVVIREDVTSYLAKIQYMMRPDDYPPMPDFVTNHIDPYTFDDDPIDVEVNTGNILSRLPPLAAAAASGVPSAMPALADDVTAPESRNAPCPCGSGRKYTHCHGATA